MNFSFQEHRDQLKQKIDILDNYVKELNDACISQSEEISNWRKKWELLDLHNNKLQAKLVQEENDHTALKLLYKHLNEQMHSNIQTIATKEKEIKHLQLKINHVSCKLFKHVECMFYKC